MVGQGEETICIHAILIIYDVNVMMMMRTILTIMPMMMMMMMMVIKSMMTMMMMSDNIAIIMSLKIKMLLPPHLKVSEHQIGRRPDRTSLCN